MSTQTLNKTVRLGLFLMLTFLTVLARPALAQEVESWTTVGSAGTVNDDDVNVVNMVNNIAQLTFDAPNTTATIHYNVVATDGIFVVGVPRMRVLFTDNGANARVKVMLKAVNLQTGVTTTVLELDSNDYGSSSNFQSQTTAPCAAAAGFNFSSHAYYIEAQLTRSGALGYPKLAAVQLYNQPSNCN